LIKMYRQIIQDRLPYIQIWGCIMFASYEELKEEKRKRQEAYCMRAELIMDGKLKSIPETRRSIYGSARNMGIELSVPKFASALKS